MRILFTIPHFYNPTGDGRYPSLRKDPAPRLFGLRGCVAALHQLFGPSQHLLEIARAISFPANQAHACEIDVVVCTTRGHHLLDRSPLRPDSFTHRAFDVEPLMLEFECQEVLRENLGKYDYYCFLEDDLILHDPWFFLKLAWFNKHTGDENLLQANRYELSDRHGVYKLYIDGEINAIASAPYQNIADQPRIVGSLMDLPVAFHRTTNPHAASYFLNHRQMERWVAQPHFLDRDTGFVGPLESAATLGIMKTFRIYKAAAPNADFLEIQHFGQEFMSGNRVGNRSGRKPVIGAV